MKTREELSDLQPDIVTINDFTKEEPLLPSLSIFKGKTACVLCNAMIEAQRFCPLYFTYLHVRSDEVQEQYCAQQGS